MFWSFHFYDPECHRFARTMPLVLSRARLSQSLTQSKKSQFHPHHRKQQKKPQERRPKGSVLVPFLFNIYISDLPTTVSGKYAYVDDLAIMHADGDWQAVEEVLTKDMATVGEYLQTWKLSAAFHLNNKEAKHGLKVKHNNETLPFCSEPSSE